MRKYRGGEIRELYLLRIMVKLIEMYVIKLSVQDLTDAHSFSFFNSN